MAQIIPLLASPVLVDPASTHHSGFLTGQSTSTGQSPFAAPVMFNGALYVILQQNHVASLCVFQVYRSTDGGNTWTVQDQANSPDYNTNLNIPSPVASMFYDSAGNITLAFSPDANPISLISGHLYLKQFSCSSNTWGATITAGAPTGIYDINQCFARPDGSILVLTTRVRSGLNLIGLNAYVYSGGAWTAPFQVDQSPAGFTPGDSSAACMDSTGRIHVFYISTDVTQDWEYVAITTANAIANHTILQSGITGFWPRYWEPCVYGNQVVLGKAGPGATQTYPTLLAGTPLSAPVFTEVPSPGIDPRALPGGATLPATPVFATDGTALYAAYFVLEASGVIVVRLLQTTSGDATTGWQPSIDALTNPFNGSVTGITPDFLNISAQASGPMAWATFQAPIVSGPATPTQFFLGQFLQVSVGSQQPGPVGGLPAKVWAALKAKGVNPAFFSRSAVLAASESAYPLDAGIAMGGCKHLNDFDACVLQEIRKQQRITFPPLCTMPKGLDPLMMPWDEDFGSYPEQSVPFNHNGGILTPTTASGDNLIYSFRVPYGYDGLLTGLYFAYSGSGFTQGSGDILFRVKLNQRYLKDLGNVIFLLGSSKQPVSMTQGQLLLSGQLIQLIVNVPNLSGMIQIGASTVSGGLIGIWWPRG